MATSSSSILRVCFVALVAVVLLAVSQSTASVQAAGITVNTTDDELNADGDCSLREAIEAANTNTGVDACTAGSGADTITFDPTEFPPAPATPATISPTSALPTITGDLTIDATGAGVIIDGAGAGTNSDGLDFNGGTLSLIGGGGLTIQNFDDEGVDVFATGAVTISGTTANNNGDDGFDVGEAASVTVTDSTANDNGDEGFDIDPTSADVSVSGSTANINDNEGFQIDTPGNITVIDSTANDSDTDDGFDIDAGGNVTITNSTANNNTDIGFLVDDADGNITVTGSTANGNDDWGFDLVALGDLTISGSTANENDEPGFELRAGNITVTDSTANDTIDDDGLELHSDGDIVVCGVTANGNFDDGIDLDEDSGQLANASVTNSVVENNGFDGIDFDTTALSSSGTFLANGNNISGNVVNGLELDGDVTVDATGNWWGADSGPSPDGTGDSIEIKTGGIVVFDPFLTAPNADAGTCEPAPTPTPTPTLTPGATATATPTPTVAAAVQLPTTGGTPSDGGSGALPWLAAIAGAIALMSAGGVLVAVRRRR